MVQDVGEVSTQLEEARAEIRRLQNSTQSQEHLIKVLARQRDHFEKLTKKPETMDRAVSPIPRTVSSLLHCCFLAFWLALY